MFEYNKIKINYIDYGNKKKPAIIFLHGWGQNIEMIKPIADPLQDNNRIIIIDLPGFGNSEEPKDVWTLDEYVECLKALVDKLKLKSVSLVGHSFGGKLSIIYASKYSVDKLVLLGSPYKISNKTKSLKTRILKALAKLPGLTKLANMMKSKIGSTDYKKASPIMRDILVEHINTDALENAKKIKVPTFIIWGDQDTMVSVNDAYELNNLIKDSGIVVYEGCSHYAYLERLGQTINILKAFFEGK